MKMPTLHSGPAEGLAVVPMPRREDYNPLVKTAEPNAFPRAAELKAIERWDEIYRLDTTHREIDETSRRIRQERRREIMRDMASLAGVLDDSDRG